MKRQEVIKSQLGRKIMLKSVDLGISQDLIVEAIVRNVKVFLMITPKNLMIACSAYRLNKLIKTSLKER